MEQFDYTVRSILLDLNVSGEMVACLKVSVFEVNPDSSSKRYSETRGILNGRTKCTAAKAEPTLGAIGGIDSSAFDRFVSQDLSYSLCSNRLKFIGPPLESPLESKHPRALTTLLSCISTLSTELS